MPGGAERHALRRHRGIGHLGIVGGDEPRHIDQDSERRRLSGEGADFHGVAFVGSAFERRDLRQAAAMALGAAEARREKGLNQLPGGRVADDEAAEADHVQVVVLDALVRGKRFMDQARADARHLVGGDRSAHAAAANGDAAIHRAGGNRAGQWHDKIRIVIVRLRPGVSKIGHLMSRSRAASRPDAASRQSRRGPRRFRSAAASSAPLGWS